MWTGAASFIELGRRVPRNGGMQEYLRAAVGDGPGFLFTWTWTLVAKPAANALIAGIAAAYLARFAAGGAEVASEPALRGLALLCVATVTLVNCLGATAGATAANLFLALKLAALVAIIGLGFVGWLLGDAAGVPSSAAGWFGLAPDARQVSLWDWTARFATAVFGALFCYGGWETVRRWPGRPRCHSSPDKDY